MADTPDKDQDDLEKLLSALDESDPNLGPEEEELEAPEAPTTSPSGSPAKSKRPSLVKKDDKKEEGKEPKEVKEDPVLAKAKTPQEIRVAPITAEQLASGKANDQIASLMHKIAAEFSGIQGAIWSNLKDDRAKIDYYLNLFTSRIDVPAETKQMYIEAITTLVATRAATSMNSSKLLDSMAKMAAAIKNIETEGQNMDLVGLLRDAPASDINEDQP